MGRADNPRPPRLFQMRSLVVSSLVALLLFAGTAHASGPPTGADATWDWYWQGEGAPAAVASNEALSTVYLYAEGGFDAKVTKAMEVLHAQGTGVEALAGEPVWAKPHNHAGLIAFVRAARDEGVDAIHLDIEPYSLRMWRTNQERLMRSYLAALTAAKRTAGEIPINVDTPYWYETGLIRKILERVDAITVMDYRDSGPEAITSASEEMRLGNEAGKPVTIGLETGDVKPASVFQEGRAALTDAIAQIRAAYGNDPAFGGIAVHDAATLAAL